MTERGFGADSGLDQEETSASKDVRTGYQDDDDQPAPRVVKETGEDDVDSHAAGHSCRLRGRGFGGPRHLRVIAGGTTGAGDILRPLVDSAWR